MRTERDVYLLRPLNDELVPAILIQDVSMTEIEEAVGSWTHFLNQQLHTGIAIPEHAHWDWRRKARAVAGMNEYTFCGIASESEIQALMLIEDTFASAKHPIQQNMSIVYIEFLATAPWNDRAIVFAPRFRGCGTTLLQIAVEHSISTGNQGRVGLHALPQSEIFYRERCGMIDFGNDPDPEHQGLRYFEFTDEAAGEFLSKLASSRRQS